MEVEVIRIKHVKFSDTGASSGDTKVGAPIQILSVRVTNGTSKKLDANLASGTMSYGPGGDEAPTVSQTGIDGMSGTICREGRRPELTALRCRRSS